MCNSFLSWELLKFCTHVSPSLHGTCAYLTALFRGFWWVLVMSLYNFYLPKFIQHTVPDDLPSSLCIATLTSSRWLLISRANILLPHNSFSVAPYSEQGFPVWMPEDLLFSSQLMDFYFRNISLNRKIQFLTLPFVLPGNFSMLISPHLSHCHLFVYMSFSPGGRQHLCLTHFWVPSTQHRSMQIFLKLNWLISSSIAFINNIS